MVWHYSDRAGEAAQVPAAPSLGRTTNSESPGHCRKEPSSRRRAGPARFGERVFRVTFPGYCRAQLTVTDDHAPFGRTATSYGILESPPR